MTDNGDKYIVEAGDTGQRLDIYLVNRLKNLTRSYISGLIANELIKVNGSGVKSGYLVKADDIVNVTLPEKKALSTEPEDLEIDIVYEDSHLAVVNKGKGMVVHPAAGALSGTLVNALLMKLNSLSGINGVIRPGIVHRLDKDTSGLIVIAKDDQAHLNLAQQIANKTAVRIYRAIVDGIVKEDSGYIIAPIARSRKDRKKMAIDLKGRSAHTDYRVLERFSDKTFMEFSLKTGRTHQIRVHCKHIHHPITGDKVYGGDTSYNDDGQLLHAYKLEFNHPVSGERMSFETPLPESMILVLEKLRKK